MNAVRVEVPKSTLALQDLEEVAYSCAFEVSVPSANKHTAERWLRVIQEGAPAPLRYFIVTGWVVALGLRLELRSPSDHILGWRILHTSPSEVVVGVQGRALSARQVVQVDHATAVHTTVVHYNLGAARVLWAVAEPIHVRVIPHRLRRAAESLG
jgi:Protein of unknown function (DUF2867)